MGPLGEARNGPVIRRPAGQQKTASMGPPWGSAERSKFPPPPENICELQWGRAWGTRNAARSVTSVRRRVVASMGPLGEARNGASESSGSPTESCFNGAALGKRGTSAGTGRWLGMARASMGPRLGNAERVSAHRRATPWQLASMGPRLGSAERGCSCADLSAARVLQWGRAWEVATA